ncbi:response regulator transcription factor [Actinomarinicola tropica]|uniref:Response regulator n=1 Tax=Actinomarinicola tropica TaxID=2789776 RepID=A0A5Q2RIA2_9ACTN|nr:response regulator transcription factor [Actinomarinicola tropica]QGG94301.1 response regulator [Actinomarinicola tropica]
MSEHHPVRVAIVDDYDVVIAGLAHMFDHYRDRIEVVEMTTGELGEGDVDVVLLDTFAQPEAGDGDLQVLVENPAARHVAVYTWVFDEVVVKEALHVGASGYLAKTLPAGELVEAIERVAAGEIVVSDPPPARTPVGQDWPGREEGLSEREAEVVALIAQGLSNAQIAERTYLSVNSIKTYIRTAYAKMGVTSRTQAVLWAIDHGFELQGRRIDLWR